MSAAIMHNTASLYDFGDLFFKNQNSSRTMIPSPNNNTTNTSPASSTSSNNTNSNSQLLSNVLGSSMQSLLTNTATTAAAAAVNHQQLTLQQQQQLTNNTNGATINANLLNNNFNQAVAAAVTNPAILQQHINAVVAQQQQQQEQQKKLWIHNALTRAVSHPQNGNVVTLMNTLIENLNGHHNALIDNLGAGTGHRKLERTQSEPLPQVNTSRYKTELCRPFEEEGECKYGEKCQFAHGAHELRNLQRHPKYKTEFCRTFHSVGFCPYGPRCHFIHNVDEARTQMHLPGYNRLTAAAVAAATAAAQANTGVGATHPLPLSPPLSMSTGSDRASPAGSLSLSPTNSMATFPFADQISPASSVFQPFTFNTPPASPQSGMSGITTPSPPPSSVVAANTVAAVAAQIFPTQLSQTTLSHHPHSLSNGHHHQQLQQHQMLNSSKHSVITSAAAAVQSQALSAVTAAHTKLCSTGSGSNATKASTEESRLPVFNRLSSTVDAFTNLTI